MKVDEWVSCLLMNSSLKRSVTFFMTSSVARSVYLFSFRNGNSLSSPTFKWIINVMSHHSFMSLSIPHWTRLFYIYPEFSLILKQSGISSYPRGPLLCYLSLSFPTHQVSRTLYPKNILHISTFFLYPLHHKSFPSILGLILYAIYSLISQT